MNNTKIILAARHNSTRLYKKALMNILNMPILEIAIRRLQKSKYSNGVIVATTEKSYPFLKDIIDKTNASYFIGSESDVLLRYVEAAEKYNVDTIVRATGDNPLVAIDALDEIILHHRNTKADLSHYVDIAYGSGVEVIEYNALKKACVESTDIFCHEHITQYHYKNEHLFKIEKPIAPDKWNMKELSVTIDTIEDYDNVKAIFENYNDIYINLETIIYDIKKNNEK